MSRDASRWFHAFLLLVLLSGVAAFALSWAYMPVGISVLLVLLMVAGFVSENVSLPLLEGGTTSLAFPMAIAAAILLGPVGAGLVALSSTITLKEIREGKPAIEVLGNAGQLSLSSIVPAWLYLAAGGRVLLDSSGELIPLSVVADFPSVVIPILFLLFGDFVMNGLLVGFGLRLRDGVTVSAFVKSVISWAFPVQVSLGVLGVALAQVLAIHAGAFAVLVFPLVVARQTYQRYLTLKGMYQDTVRSLVAALEAKDPYTRGHSERVAGYAVKLARHIGVTEEGVERLGLAAQLHDLGKVAISSTVLQKPASLTRSEYEEIRQHPVVGARIVQTVPGLEGIAEIVRYHHERYDGQGYAAGLAGEDIPMESRLLAIADSYDAMTTARAYREGLQPHAALEEIRVSAGTQFDPMLAAAFIEIELGGARDD